MKKIKKFKKAAKKRFIIALNDEIDKKVNEVILIDDLLRVFLPDTGDEIRRYVDRIIRMKKDGIELAEIDRSAIFEEYMMSQLSELSLCSFKKTVKEAPESFDLLFREMLKIVG